MREVGYLQRLYRDARSTEHKTPVIDQIPTELMKSESKAICYVFHKLFDSICIQKELLK